MDVPLYIYRIDKAMTPTVMSPTEQDFGLVEIPDDMRTDPSGDFTTIKTKAPSEQIEADEFVERPI